VTADPVLERYADAVRTTGSTGTRTAADLPYGPPPPQLAGAFLTPEGPSVLYGPGGVGKGITACWLILQLVRAGHVVLVLDFEGHEREWGSRLRGLGATDDELGQIHYRAPFGSDWTAPAGPLADVADLLREEADRIAATYLVVDSYSVATTSGDTLGGQEAAREYFTGLTIIGRPSLTLAHVRGGADRFPERPFGSVFVHNLARETWAAERVGVLADAEPDGPPTIGPVILELEFRNRKASGRERSRPQFLTIEFYPDGSIEAVDGRLGPSVADLAADALRDGPLTLAKLRAAIKEDTGEPVTEDVLRVTLKRHPDRFTVDRSRRPAIWAAV
jgi:hypothetical protein